MIIIKRYPQDSNYHSLFEEVRQFILRANESLLAINYSWSRWEWYFARKSFSDKDLENHFLFYKDQKLVGMMMLEDEADIYYYITDDYEVKSQIVNLLKKLPKAKLMVEDIDQEMIQLLESNKYIPSEYQEHMAKRDISLLDYHLLDGYDLLCLADTYDVRKHHLCLWQGFNHKGEPRFDKEVLISRERQISSPNFKRRYAYVVTYKGSYVAYTSIWYEKGTNIAMIEPVCTVPEYRRKGLATATIAKCIEQVKKDGAKEVYVGSNQDFYKKIGFNVIRVSTVYERKVSE